MIITTFAFLILLNQKEKQRWNNYLTYFFLLAGLWLAGCDDSSDASLIPEIMPTEQGSDTYVMKGYESAGNGFNVYKPEAIGTPFYIKSRLLPVVIMRLLLSVVNRSKGLPSFQLPMLSAKMPKWNLPLAIGYVLIVTTIIKWESFAWPILTATKWV